MLIFFFFQAEDGIRDIGVTGVQTCALPILAKRFGALTALRDVNLRLAKGEVLGLIGDNGAGKSTLIKIICGFHRPDSGRILVNGEEVVLRSRSEEHTSELQSRQYLVCRLLLEKKKKPYTLIILPTLLMYTQ